MLVSEMLSEIRDHGFDDLTDTRILSFLNDTYFDVCSREPWPFLEASAAVTVDAAGKVTSPTNINKVLAIVPTTAGAPRLVPSRLDEFTKAWGSQLSQSGDPHTYFFIGNDLYVYPIPATAALTVRYVRTPDPLTVSPDSSPIIPSRHHRVVVLGGLQKCYVMEDDPDQAATFTNMFEQRIMQMRNDLWMQQYDRTQTLQDLDDEDWVDWLYGV